MTTNQIILIISLLAFIVYYIYRCFKEAKEINSKVEDYDKKIEYFYVFKSPVRKSYKIVTKENDAKIFAKLNPEWKVSVSKENEDIENLEWESSSTYWNLDKKFKIK